MDVPYDALPCTGYDCENINFSVKRSVRDSRTHVSHEPIKANMGQKISNLRTYYHLRTISTFLRSVIREQCGGFSMDLEERATFEPLSAFSYL